VVEPMKMGKTTVPLVRVMGMRILALEPELVLT